MENRVLEDTLFALVKTFNLSLPKVILSALEMAKTFLENRE
jgi:hypothetical protein